MPFFASFAALPGTRLREEITADDPLGEFLVWWDDVTSAHVRRFAKRLENSRIERDMQGFLEREPMLLIQHLGGGHGRWVLPQKRLGDRYITDFVIGEKSSVGFEWTVVELESPSARMFKRNGEPTAALQHALQQVRDWRSWLGKNQSYAAKPRLEQGLGLTNIRSDLAGLIIIGRRSQTDPRTNDRRQQLMSETNCRIHSYDFLIEAAKGRVRDIQNSRKLRQSAAAGRTGRRNSA